MKNVINKQDLLFSGKWGIEREALRITSEGFLTRLAHPAELAEPEFARDFAEAQLEIITPPMGSPHEVFSALRDQTKKAYSVLKAAGMNCYGHFQCRL